MKKEIRFILQKSGKLFIVFLTLFLSPGLYAQINIGSGATLTLGSSTLTLPVSWNNSGTFNPGSGTVIFNGASGNQTIANSSGETFNKLIVNKAAGEVQLVNNITISDTIILTSGDVNMTGNTITLDSMAMVSETPGNTIKGGGSITGTKWVTAPAAENVFGLGAIITTSAGLGSTTITRRHTELTSGGNTSILRNYDIVPSNNSGLNADLVFTYDESELNGKNEFELVLFKSTDGGTSWLPAGGTVNETDNTVSLSGIDDFSLWTLAADNAPLPVELSSFTASGLKNSILLKWTTTSEIDNYGFEIQRTSIASGQQVTAGFIKGNGTSNSLKQYEFTDKNLTAGMYSYRLKQIDNDGTFKLSEKIEIEVGGAPLEFALAQNYPNPFNPETMIEFTVPESGNASLKIFSSIGEEVAVLFDEFAEAGKYHQVRFNASSLATGIYIAKLQYNGKQMLKKMLMIK